MLSIGMAGYFATVGACGSSSKSGSTIGFNTENTEGGHREHREMQIRRLHGLASLAELNAGQLGPAQLVQLPEERPDYGVRAAG